MEDRPRLAASSEVLAMEWQVSEAGSPQVSKRNWQAGYTSDETVLASKVAQSSELRDALWNDDDAGESTTTSAARLAWFQELQQQQQADTDSPADVDSGSSLLQQLQLPQSVWVAGVGELRLPLSHDDAFRLREEASTSPHCSSSSTWEVDGAKLASCPGNARFLDRTAPDLAAAAARGLGVAAARVGGAVSVNPVPRALIYCERGGKLGLDALLHAPRRQAGGGLVVVGAMVVQLPTRPGHRGGAVVVTGGGGSSSTVVETAARSGSSFYCAAVLSECDVAEDDPVAAGARLCVVWDLVTAYAPPGGGAWFVAAAARVEAALRPWVQALEDGAAGGAAGGSRVPEKLAVRLEHEYAEGGMWFGGLKGRDRVVAELLRAYTGSRPCRRRHDEEDDEEDQDEEEEEESRASTGGEWHPGARAGPLELCLCVWERRVTVYRRTGVAVRADVLRGWVGADGTPDAALAPADPGREWSLNVDTELVTPLPGHHLQLEDDGDNIAAQEPPEQQQEPVTPRTRRPGAPTDRTHNDGHDDSDDAADDEGPSDTRRRQRAVIVVFPSTRRTLMACQAGNFRTTLAAALHKRLTHPRAAATDLRHLLHYLATSTATSTTAPWSQRVKADLLHLCQAVGHRRDAATVLGLIAKSAAGTNAGALGDAQVARGVAAVVRRHGWHACAEGVGRVMAAAAHAGARPAAAVAREVPLYVVLATELKGGGCDRAAAIVAAKVVQLALGCSSSLSRGAMADVRDMGHRCLNRVGARDQGLNMSYLI